MKKSICYKLVLILVLAIFVQSAKAQENKGKPKISITAETKNSVVESYLKKLGEIYIFPEVAVAYDFQHPF